MEALHPTLPSIEGQGGVAGMVVLGQWISGANKVIE